MPEETRTTRQHSAPGHRLVRWFRHLLHHLPGALIVSSLVAIGHLHFHLLDAIDGYAFISIGNLSAVNDAANAAPKPTVAVVVIDQKSYEIDYRERSPLNRCQLLKDLGAIYHGRRPPKLVVIDLDLSPAPLLRDLRAPRRDAMRPLDSGSHQADESECEERLYRLLESRNGVSRTVLMEPFMVLNEPARQETLLWKERMSRAGITFGDATLPIHFGLVTRVECRVDGLPAVAFQQYSPKVATNCLANGGSTTQVLISPRQYLTGLHASSVADLPSRRSWIRDGPEITFAPLPYELPVVFFGGGYGEGDTYLTPLGTMYGVEVHAAAYMSLVEPATDLNHLLGFLLEVLLAVVFGVVISWCWRNYYHLRYREDSFHQVLAPWVVVLLAIALVFLVVATTVGSFFLLGKSAYWLSPVPIAIGMLIESFFTGSVHEAIAEGRDQRQALINGLAAAHQRNPDRFNVMVEVERLQQLPGVRRNPGRPWQSGRHPIARAIKTSIEALLKTTRRLLFFAIVGLAIYLAFRH